MKEAADHLEMLTKNEVKPCPLLPVNYCILAPGPVMGPGDQGRIGRGGHSLAPVAWPAESLSFLCENVCNKCWWLLDCSFKLILPCLRAMAVPLRFQTRSLCSMSRLRSENCSATSIREDNNPCTEQLPGCGDRGWPGTMPWPSSEKLLTCDANQNGFCLYFIKSWIRAGNKANFATFCKHGFWSTPAIILSPAIFYQQVKRSSRSKG